MAGSGSRTKVQVEPTNRTAGYRERWVVAAGVVAAFLVAFIYATSSTLSSGDTWIALAAGRQIAEQGYANFPKLDTFSYSFTGQQWTNQNWLAHVIIWWLYDHLCPSATLLYELICVAGGGLLVVWAAHLNGAGAKLGALGAAIAYIVGFNYFDIRPAGMSHLLAASIHALLLASAYRSRIWLCGIPFVLLIWGNAHGSFPFGFLLLILWGFGSIVDCWRFERSEFGTRIQTAAWLGLIAIISAAVVVLVNPFGIENFTHPFVVLGSAQFRQIIEWAPAYRLSVPFPPVIPFFVILAGYAVVLGLFTFTRVKAVQKSPPSEIVGQRIMSGEVFIAMLGVCLGLYSRRFTPTAVYLSIPLMMKLLVMFAERIRLSSRTVNTLVGGLAALIIVGIISVGGWRITKGYRPIEGTPLREWMFERRVNIKNEPTDIVAFAKSNQITGRVFAEWEWAAYCIFNWPGCRVFIDGRSQALYSESMFIFYNTIERIPPPAAADMVKQGERLDALLAHPDTPTKLGAELFIMKRFERPTDAIFNPLIVTKKWVPLYANEIGILLLRREEATGPLKAVLEKYDRLALDWPATMWGHFSKALAAQSITKPDFESAITSYKQAIAGGPRLAFYQGLAQCYVQVGRAGELKQYLQSELQRLEARADRDMEDTPKCIQFIRQILRMN